MVVIGIIFLVVIIVTIFIIGAATDKD